MYLTPRYDDPPVITFDPAPDDVLAPLVRQRRRMERLAGTFTEADWDSPSRCAGWTVRDIYAHLVSINPFYELSALAGAAGEPTRMLLDFCPAETPPTMVEELGPLTGPEVLGRFAETNTSLFTALESLTLADWNQVAESPPGHVPMRLLCLHALWDSWVHERDVCLPLGREQDLETDEAILSLQYVAGLSPAFSICAGRDYRGTFAVAATNPATQFAVVVENAVMVAPNHASPAGVPVLHGSTVELVDALTTRTPLPSDAPAEWQWLLNGLKGSWNLELLNEEARPPSAVLDRNWPEA